MKMVISLLIASHKYTRRQCNAWHFKRKKAGMLSDFFLHIFRRNPVTTIFISNFNGYDLSLSVGVIIKMICVVLEISQNTYFFQI